MQHSLPKYAHAKTIALASAAFLHGGLAAWAMMPEPPVALPQQQIIQISMVAPTQIQQQPTPDVPVLAQEAPKIPPKEKGMVKLQQAAENKAEKPEKKEEKKLVVERQVQTQLTSGIQANDATEKNAAITKPVAADYLKNPPPRYPSDARRRRQQGAVMLSVSVTPSGAPRMVQVARSSGHSLLDEAALEAVRQWQFVPARRGSQTVEGTVLVPIEFRIN